MFDLRLQTWTRKANSTGLKPRRFVTVNSNEKAQYPASGAVVVGALVTGSTGSTRADQSVTILSGIIVKVEAAGGALKAGMQCQASSIGRATTMKTGGSAVGFVVSGSTGSTGRVVAVLFAPYGVTT